MSQVNKSLFCRISKVDEEKRTVTGIGASETPDLEGEIFDYDGSKPYIEAWSASAVARSQGKSFGNIREMHQPSAVGKLSEPIVFDDANKLVILTAYISDDEAWKKCEDGTYTGFSICGPVVGEKWADAGNPGAKRFICSPIEFSVCDMPCNPGAVFTAVKAGGVTEERKFKTAAAVEENTMPATVQKSMYSIQDLASIISSIRWTQDDLAWEADYEGDGSPIPAKLKAWIAEGCEILIELTREETSELVNAMKTAGEKVIQKRATPPAQVPAVDPAAKAATEPQSQGASPENEETPMDEAQKAQLAKAAQDAAESLRIAQENQTAIESLTEVVTKSVEATAALTRVIAGEPVAAKSAGAGVTAVSKETENTPAAAAAPAVTANDPQSVAKSILAQPKIISDREFNLGR